MFRSSRALELSLQGCLAEPAGSAAGGDAAGAALQSLLAACAAPPLDAGRAPGLAASLGQWRGLLAGDGKAPPRELLAAAQRALGVVASALVAPLSAPPATSRQAAAAAGDPEAALVAVRRAAAAAAAPKEAAAARRSLLQLTERRLGGAPSGVSDESPTQQSCAGVDGLVAYAEQRLRVSFLCFLFNQPALCR